MLANVKESRSRKVLFLALGIVLIIFQLAIALVPSTTNDRSLLGVAFAGAYERFGFLLFGPIGVLSLVYGVLAIKNGQNPKGHSVVLTLSLSATVIMATYVCAATYLTDNMNLTILGVHQIVAVVAMLYGGPVPTVFVLLAYPYALLTEPTVAQYLLDDEYKTFYIMHLIGEVAAPAMWAATAYLFTNQRGKLGIVVGVVIGYFNKMAITSLFGTLKISAMPALADDVSWGSTITYLLIAALVTIGAFVVFKLCAKKHRFCSTEE